MRTRLTIKTPWSIKWSAAVDCSSFKCRGQLPHIQEWDNWWDLIVTRQTHYAMWKWLNNIAIVFFFVNIIIWRFPLRRNPAAEKVPTASLILQCRPHSPTVTSAIRSTKRSLWQTDTSTACPRGSCRSNCLSWSSTPGGELQIWSVLVPNCSKNVSVRLFLFMWRGVKDVMKKRLKSHYRKQKLMQSAAEGGPTDTYYDYICVVDFEATCEEDNPSDFLHEIIEFPLVLINTHTLQIVSAVFTLSWFISYFSRDFLTPGSIPCAGGHVSVVRETGVKP